LEQAEEEKGRGDEHQDEVGVLFSDGFFQGMGVPRAKGTGQLEGCEYDPEISDADPEGTVVQEVSPDAYDICAHQQGREEHEPPQLSMGQAKPADPQDVHYGV